jgi:hypothetical protein
MKHETLQDCETFEDQLCYYHRKLMCENIYDNYRDVEALCGLLEGMTNINTIEKIEQFNKITECN